MNSTDLPAALRFSHEAMNTTFTLHLQVADRKVAAHMAKDCFDRLELLESHLSRFAHSSDISRINHLRTGETVYIAEETHRCLLAALDAYSRTGGLFDITLGSQIAHLKDGEEGAPPLMAGSLTIHPDAPAVTCNEAGRQLDLGGIGKGFALDELRDLLVRWDAPGGLLAAGASSLLTFGPQEWPVDLAGDAGSKRISLFNGSLSVSGTGIQGSHIVHPAGVNAGPAHAVRRLWVTAPTATFAEIWSTALFLLEPDDVAAFVGDDDTVGEIHIDRDGVIHQLR